MTIPLLETISSWALHLIQQSGYVGIFVTQALESALVPIPSEVVLPFSGFLAATGRLTLAGVIATATLANTLGALVIYIIGKRYGRGILERFGHYFLIHADDIKRVDGWLVKHGAGTAFFSRLLPGVRTFSSIVLGAAQIPLRQFILYTLAGSLIWNGVLAYVGYAVGDNWNFLQPYFKKAELIIALAILLAVVLFVRSHLRRRHRSNMV